MRPQVVVVGGGISGLAAAWRLKLTRPDADITVIEASARFGGKLISEHRDGFIVEGAADGFLARKPPALAWAEELGLSGELIVPRPEHRFSHVLWDGALHRMPEGFSGLVPTDPEALKTTTLLTPEGVARVAAESAVPLKLDAAEESIAAFFTRRFGEEAFTRLLEPLLAGIYAGDASRLSADAAFPQLTAIERAGKTLMTALAPQPAPANAGRDPAFRSFGGGMAALPAALEARLRTLDVALAAGTPVTGIARSGGGFVVRTASAEYATDAVIVALPPHAAGSLLGTAASGAAAVLSAWPTSSVANLNLAFRSDGVELPGGSGFVVPRAAGLPFSAGTWSSRKWPGRAPDGLELARFYFGGAREPSLWTMPEDEMEQRALDLLQRLTGSRPRPLWRRVFRWKDAFAQPDLGHAERHRALEAAAVPGLVFAGAYFAGVGIPDCLARAGQAADAVDSYLKTAQTIR